MKIFSLKFLLLCLLLILITPQLRAQEDTLSAFVDKNSAALDSLKLKVKDIYVSGNKVTKDYIILREMQLKPGEIFTVKKYTQDILNIYNLGLFTKVDIIPVPADKKQILLNVDVQERWYILPLPSAGVEDGEYWKKFWASLNLRWDNFRGRNESLNFGFRVFYNPSVKFSYTVPWIGEKLHLYTTYSIEYAKSRNKSLIAVGRGNEGEAITYNDVNYDNFDFSTRLTVGKYISREFSVFTEAGYNYLRVSDYASGRTLNTNGKDRYLSFTVGVGYDNRNIREFATKGYYLRTTFTRYGFLDKVINFGRYTLQLKSFIPLNITKSYFLTIASNVYTSLAIGSVIPVYNHEFLGYGEDYIRGWRKIAYEGEDALVVYNELRIPILSPRYIKAKRLPIVNKVPIIKNLDLRHGLFATIIYDVGTIFDKSEVIFKKKFLSGVGVGLDFIAPFGYVVRADWTFRLAKPIVGQISFGLHAKF